MAASAARARARPLRPIALVCSSMRHSGSRWAVSRRGSCCAMGTSSPGGVTGSGATTPIGGRSFLRTRLLTPSPEAKVPTCRLSRARRERRAARGARARPRWARSRSRASSWWRPMICMPTGSPSNGSTGTEMAGLPAMLAGMVERAVVAEIDVLIADAGVDVDARPGRRRRGWWRR